MNYKCCKLKPFVHYVCTKCCSVFHKSCLQQQWKKKVKFVKDNKIICCQENTDEEHEEENSLLEKTINELAEDGFMKDKYIQKLKDENKIVIRQALDSENEMNSLIEKQKKYIEEMECKIKELLKEVAEKVVSVKTADTQTCYHSMNHQSTMTDSLANSGVDIEELKNIKKIGKNKIKKKLQLGRTSVRHTKKNTKMERKLTVARRCKNKKVPDKNETNIKPSGGHLEEIINLDTTLHDEIQTVVHQDCMKKPFENADDSPDTYNEQVNSESKILILGDQYATGFSKVVKKTMTKTNCNVTEIIKPETELSDLTSNVFDYSLRYGQNDYVIVMFNTKNVSNNKSLNAALKNIMMISKTTNLIIISECDTIVDHIINHKIRNAVNRTLRLVRNCSIKFLVDKNEYGSKFDICNELENYLIDPMHKNVILTTIKTIENANFQLLCTKEIII